MKEGDHLIICDDSDPECVVMSGMSWEEYPEYMPWSQVRLRTKLKYL